MKRFDDDDEEYIESCKHKKSKSYKKQKKQNVDIIIDDTSLKLLEQELFTDKQTSNK